MKEYTINDIKEFINEYLDVEWSKLILDPDFNDDKFAKVKDFDGNLKLLRVRSQKTHEVKYQKFNIGSYMFLTIDENNVIINLTEQWQEFINNKKAKNLEIKGE